MVSIGTSVVVSKNTRMLKVMRWLTVGTQEAQECCL